MLNELFKRAFFDFRFSSTQFIWLNYNKDSLSQGYKEEYAPIVYTVPYTHNLFDEDEGKDVIGEIVVSVICNNGEIIEVAKHGIGPYTILLRQVPALDVAFRPEDIHQSAAGHEFHVFVTSSPRGLEITKESGIT